MHRSPNENVSERPETVPNNMWNACDEQWMNSLLLVVQRRKSRTQIWIDDLWLYIIIYTNVKLISAEIPGDRWNKIFFPYVSGKKKPVETLWKPFKFELFKTDLRRRSNINLYMYLKSPVSAVLTPTSWFFSPRKRSDRNSDHRRQNLGKHKTHFSRIIKGVGH